MIFLNSASSAAALAFYLGKKKWQLKICIMLQCQNFDYIYLYLFRQTLVLFWIESSSFRARHYTAQIPTGSSKIYALPGSYRLLSTAVQAVEYCSRLLNTAVQVVVYCCTGCLVLVNRLLRTAVQGVW